MEKRFLYSIFYSTLSYSILQTTTHHTSTCKHTEAHGGFSTVSTVQPKGITRNFTGTTVNTQTCTVFGRTMKNVGVPCHSRRIPYMGIRIVISWRGAVKNMDIGSCARRTSIRETESIFPLEDFLRFFEIFLRIWRIWRKASFLGRYSSKNGINFSS